MPKFTEKNAILEEGVFLPKFLFYFDRPKSKNISSAATFDPSSALTGEGFKSSTSPSQSPRKKTIIIDKNSLSLSAEYGETIALLKRLQVAGFEIFLRSAPTENNQGVFHKLDKDLTNIDQLRNLSEFDQSLDYGELTRNGVVRDNTLLFGQQEESESHITEVEQAFFSQNIFQGFGLAANGWKLRPRDIEEECALQPEDPVLLQRVVFILQQVELLNDSPTLRGKLFSEIKNALDSSSIPVVEDIFFRDALFILNSSVETKAEILPYLDEKARKWVFKTQAGQIKKFANFADSLSTRIESIETFFKAIEAFPESLDDYLKCLLSPKNHLLEGEIILQTAKLVDRIPNKKPELLQHLRERIKEAAPIDGKGLLTIRSTIARAHTGILINLCEGRENEALIYFNDIESLPDAGLLTVEAYLSFILASKQTDSKRFFTDKLLQILSSKIEDPSCSDLVLMLTKSIENCSPQTADKIVDLILTKNRDCLTEDLLVQAIRSRPKRDKELLDVYFKENGNGPISTSSLIALPAKTRGYLDPDAYEFVTEEDLKDRGYCHLWRGVIGEHITYANIPHITDYSILCLNGTFPNLTTVQITDSFKKEAIIDFVKTFCEKRPSVKCFILPMGLGESRDLKLKDLQKTFSNRISFDFVDYAKDLYLAESDFAPTATAAEIIPSEESYSKKTQNPIHLCRNGALGFSTLAGNFSMSLVGEVLNDLEITPQIRTALLKRNITQNLTEEKYLASTRVEVKNLRSLTSADIDNFRKKRPSTIYYQISQTLVANKEFRLPSADAAEELIGIFGDTSGLAIAKGEDDFFYTISTRNRELTYVVSAPHPQQDIFSYKALSDSHSIRKIIDEYRDPKSGYTETVLPEKKEVDYDSSDHDSSMKRMFEERSGACIYRVAAVEYKLRTTPSVNQKDLRVVKINENHVALEIKTDRKWIRVDLGGDVREMRIDEEKYTPEAVATIAAAPDSGIASKENSSDRMATRLQTFSAIEEISNAETLKSKTLLSAKNKIFVTTTKIEDHANFFLQEATAQGREVFYIDKPSKIDLHRINLKIANDNIPILSPEGLLTEFLQNAARHPDSRPLLVINWDAFSAKERASLNTIIDEKRKINGEEIDDSIQIIGLASEASQDWSFRSRHNLSLASKTILPHSSVTNLAEKTLIDLEGFPDWRRNLFGKVVLVGDKMEWRKSEFVLALESDKNNFEFSNLSPEAANDLMSEFAQAKAIGKFIYHGHEIPLPQNAQISFDARPFDFRKFSKKPLESFDSGNYLIINTSIFDSVICSKEIADGKYFERDGLIENAAESEGKILSLLITSDLSPSQWYCLFNEAKKHEVTLNLLFAPGVVAPSEIEFSPQPPVLSSTAEIFVSNDPNRTLEDIEETQVDIFAVVDVEDLTYQDLIENIGFSITEEGFTDFTKTESELLTNLKNGKKIILKGEFSTDLLQMLEPILTSEVSKNLILIIEDKTCQSGIIPNYLQWAEECKIDLKDSRLLPATKFEFFEEPNLSSDLKNSKTESDQFITNRKVVVSKTLESYNMLRLIGHSGVGKSRLLREFEESDKDKTLVCRELSEFEKWAKDESDKIKILFIDESNIEDLHFTMFSPLKTDVDGRIFYQGKFYDLTEKHKVVFACNPVEYGGGRLEQKLFSDGAIPALYLRDFPASYIYEKILKEAIYDELDPEFKKNISEEYFKDQCQLFIEEYQVANSEKKSDEANGETVRELQEKVLHLINTLISRQEFTEISTTNFISTQATREAEWSLISSLNIRKRQREGDFPSHACGLNGVLLEGDSGVGKSVLIEAVLVSKGIEEIKAGEANSDERQRYYKIEASLPLKEKREIIAKAFEQGQVVWIDEINSCIDDGLEKILNAALTGEHPDGKKDPHKPGFMLISSVNSSGFEGRSLISPSLKHRTIQPKVRGLKEYSTEDLTKIIAHWLEQERGKDLAKIATYWLGQENEMEIAKNIAQDFKKCLQARGGENLNLRMLKENLSEILKPSTAIKSSAQWSIAESINECRVS